FDSVVVNNGIDQVKFNPAKRFKDVRAEFGIGKEELLVLFIARFTGHKQPLALIEAFAKALPRRPELKLLLVGDGDQKEEAKALIHRLGISHKVILESFRQDVPDVLAAADLFVLPSLWEGLPIGLLEAMAMGKAVIATDVDGTREVVQDRENGLLIQTESLIPNLTSALVELSGDPDLRARFREAAIRTVNERFNAAHMTRQIENIYHRLTSKRLAGLTTV
ncbi:MAG TPA: glycosyltransferase family 4 protein, partial [Chitinophagaceae bacterium]|nr:glycosyltransferase family 4 protein [Chitinophagaceae bacterium]